MKIQDLIAVEYSVQQAAFHLHSVKGMTQVNLMNATIKGTMDYLPLGIFETVEEANDFISSIRNKIKKNE